MRRNLSSFEFDEKVARVVAHVGSKSRDTHVMLLSHTVNHFESALALGTSIRFSDGDCKDESMSILRQRMHRVTEKCADIVALTCKSRVGIGRAAMSCVSTSFAAKINAFVAGTFAWCATRGLSRRVVVIWFGVLSRKRFTLDALETFQRRVTLNERTVNREVIVARESGILCLLHDAFEKSCNESMLCGSVTIFCEDSRIEGFIVGSHVEEPLKEEIRLQSPTELALGSDRVQTLQEQCLQESLGRNARASIG